MFFLILIFRLKCEKQVFLRHVVVEPQLSICIVYMYDLTQLLVIGSVPVQLIRKYLQQFRPVSERTAVFEHGCIQNLSLYKVLEYMTPIAQFRDVTRFCFGDFRDQVKFTDI